MFEAFDVSVSGLVAHRIWQDTSAANVAHMFDTRDAQGRPNPYRRHFPIFAPAPDGRGVRVVEIQTDDKFRWQLQPGHPDSEKSGPWKDHVRMPAIDLYKEMANSMVAQRAYEANITALQVTKQMIASDLRILG